MTDPRHVLHELGTLLRYHERIGEPLSARACGDFADRALEASSPDQPALPLCLELLPVLED